jgi:hypothetical protein
MFVNLPAARAAGILLIPMALGFLPKILYTRPGKVLIIYYFYLAYLGIIFGFIIPWPDGGLLRQFNQIAPGRAIIFLIRSAADLSLAIFVARQVVKLKSPDKVVRYILFGTSVAALWGVFEFLSRVDLYGLITGVRSLSIEYRMRGFCYEPRALGLITSQGMLLSLLLYSHKRSWKLLTLTGLHALAFFLAGSTSALVACFMGAAILVLFERKVRSSMFVLATLGVMVLTLLVMTKSQYLTTYVENVRVRLTVDRIERPAENAIENLAFRMDIFDGPALLFLYYNPLHLFVGTGPGLVGLPATAYLPPSRYFAWVSETGINTPPTSGFMLELSNTGIIGLAMWLIICVSIFRAFKYLSRQEAPEDLAWRIGGGAFAIALGVYFMQNSPLSAIWPVFIGIGLAAYYLARVKSKLSRDVTQLADR